VSHVAVVTGDLDGYRAFYEEIIGLETTLVLGAGSGHGRQAVLSAGAVLLHVFEMIGYDPSLNGFGPAMFERGRLDHLGFTVADVAALDTVRDRLVAVDASSGVIRRVGPMLSLRFYDPDESEGEINCLDPSYDPSTLRDEDDVINPLWFARMASVLRADPTTDVEGSPEEGTTSCVQAPQLGSSSTSGYRAGPPDTHTVHVTTARTYREGQMMRPSTKQSSRAARR
jgi:catechol 2,3-dioxygenase-like lactoylglutathione lyase family enzyme